jgi:hypothetical protein
MTTMSKAVCWELATNNGAVTGMRVLLAGRFVGTQMLVSDNARPRWSFTPYGTATEAAEAAVKATQHFESEWQGTLVIPPGEIILHPSEADAMTAGRPIQPALRARVFTSLMRRDPRVMGGNPDA